MRLFKAITLSGRRRRAAAAYDADRRAHPCVVFCSAHTVTAQVRILTCRGFGGRRYTGEPPLPLNR
jgi:hypothetical protein